MDKTDALLQINDGLKCLIGKYPEGHPMIIELKKAQEHILGLMLGDKAGTLSLDSDNSVLFGKTISMLSETRIKRALDRMGQDEKVAGRLLEREQLKQLLAD